MEALLMFPALLFLIFMGVPVAFALMGVAFVFGLLAFGEASFFLYTQKIEEIAGNFILAAVPMFVFMGAML